MIRILKIPALHFAVGTALLWFTSCSTEPPPASSRPVISNVVPGTDAEGFAGKTVVTSITTNATVASLDVAAKKMELKMPDGTTRAYDIDPTVIPQEHLKPGASVRVSIAEERTVFLGTNAAPPGAG